jgi:hypothetical protein
MCEKNLCLLAPRNFSPAWERCEHEFTSRMRHVKAFKGTIKKILKVLAALSLGLIYALVTLAISTFIVTMSL